MRKLAMYSLAVILLIASAGRSAEDGQAEDEGVQLGAKPALRLPRASGDGEFNLRQYRGSLVLVHFWDPRSEVGVEELQSVAAVHDRYGSRGLEVLDVIVARDTADYRDASRAPEVDAHHARASLTADRSVLREWLGEPPFDLPRRFLLAPDGALIWKDDQEAAVEAAVRKGLARHPPFRSLDAAAASELIENPRVILLDVRTPAEFASGHLEGAMNINIMRKDFSEAVRRLPEDREYVVYCKSGGRSMHACEIMSNFRFERLRNLKGGITAWQEADLPVVGTD